MEYEQPQKTAPAKIVADDGVESKNESILDNTVQIAGEGVSQSGVFLPPEAAPSKAVGIIQYYFLRLIATAIETAYSALVLSVAVVIIFAMVEVATQTVIPIEEWVGLFTSSGLFLCSLTLLESILMQGKVANSEHQTSPGKSAAGLFLIDVHGRPLSKKRKVLRSFTKFGLLFLSLYLTAKFKLPIFVIPLLMFNRRFIHDYIGGTCVVGENENLKTTFYPRGSMWTQAVMCWIAVCLFILPFKWNEFESRANVYCLRFYDFGNSVAHLSKVEEALYPSSGESWAQGWERFQLLRDYVALKKELGLAHEPEVELRQRAWSALEYNDPDALKFFAEYINSDPGLRERQFEVGANPYVEYAKLLMKAKRYKDAYTQVHFYLSMHRNHLLPTRYDCEIIETQALRMMKTHQGI